MFPYLGLCRKIIDVSIKSFRRKTLSAFSSVLFISILIIIVIFCLVQDFCLKVLQKFLNMIFDVVLFLYKTLLDILEAFMLAGRQRSPIFLKSRQPFFFLANTCRSMLFKMLLWFLNMIFGFFLFLYKTLLDVLEIFMLADGQWLLIFLKSRQPFFPDNFRWGIPSQNVITISIYCFCYSSVFA